jgi:uncharacterized membrane protein YkvA (DUF1232 family)
MNKLIKQAWRVYKITKRVGGMKAAASLVKDAPKWLTLMQRLMLDPRVPAPAKALLVGAGIFAVSPLNIPQYIPVIGALDDIGIILFAGTMFFKHVPEHVLAEHKHAVGLKDVLGNL